LNNAISSDLPTPGRLDGKNNRVSGITNKARADLHIATPFLGETYLPRDFRLAGAISRLRANRVRQHTKSHNTKHIIRNNTFINMDPSSIRCSSPESQTQSQSEPSSPSSSKMPRIPEHIIVTFDGQTREIMRIVREEEDEERRPRPTRTTSGPRPRFYQREEID
jgi:hypothetical protein